MRRLEDEIFRILNKGQARLDFGVVYFGNRVRLSQFYGIEINDFAVRVARVALFIAQLQSNVESVMSLGVHGRDLLPLEDCATIVHGNALRMPWNEVLPANKCSYIIGNPPFIGANNQSSEQKAEVQELFKDHHHASLIDYVGCWYKKASLYMRGIAEEGFQLKVNAKDGSPEGGVHSAVPSAVQPPSGPPEGYRNSTASPSRIKAAFVSTNSICQGEQVANLWQPLFDDGLEIVFAHKDFRWSNEAKDGAHVFVSIIGFHFNEEENKTLFTYETPDSEPHKNAVTNINAYLTNAPNIFITRITKPLCKIPKMTKGCQPTDGGNLIIEADDLEEFLTKEPRAEKFIKKLVGSREFIQQKPRYCLWLVDASAAEIQAMPLVKERVKACRDFRLSSSQAGTRKLADRCTTFRETYCPKTNLIVPSVCSERRKYIPIGYVDNTTISTNANLIVPEGTLYMCGILQSQAHNAWMRVVCGRLESRYRYSAGIVYNNFPWPGVTRETLETPVEACVSEAVRASVEACAQAVLDAREQYVAQAREAGLTCSLADMYDPENAFLYPALTRAHAALDAAVEEAYGVNFAGDEERIVAHLFSLYEQLSRA